MTEPSPVIRAATVALNKVTKWRTLFAGWQLGTRSSDDPEAAAVRDHRDATTILRVELSALTRTLIDNGLITHDEYAANLITEAASLEEAYEQRFPGVRATSTGLDIDLSRAMVWMKRMNWKP